MRSVLGLDSSDAKPLSNFFTLGFSLCILNSNHSGQRVLTQSSRNHTEQPTMHVGWGGLFIVAVFPMRKDNFGHDYSANAQSTCI